MLERGELVRFRGGEMLFAKQNGTHSLFRERNLNTDTNLVVNSFYALPLVVSVFGQDMVLHVSKKERSPITSISLSGR